MQVSLTTTGGLERRLEVAVPGDRVTSEVESRLKQLSRTARLKGFRPGKAPLAVIQKQFGEQVRSEVVSDLIRSSYSEAVNQEKLNPAGGDTKLHPVINRWVYPEYTVYFERDRVISSVMNKGPNEIGLKNAPPPQRQ